MRRFFLLLAAVLVLSKGLAMNASAADTSPATSETAIFAGGCFWCMHAAFEGLDGVTKVVSGYTGGHVKNPTYEQVSTGNTGHIEVIEVTFNPQAVPYTKLLEYFWDNVDPTDPEGQFCDKGSQYLAGIFYLNDAQKELAEISVADAEKRLKQKVSTFIRPAEPFYAAEDYHQSYHKKNELRYQLYKMGCGRDKTLKRVWSE